MPALEFKCLYCGATDDELYLVRVATKPKFYPHRWHVLGYCCHECARQGQQIEFELTPVNAEET